MTAADGMDLDLLDWIDDSEGNGSPQMKGPADVVFPAVLQEELDEFSGDGEAVRRRKRPGDHQGVSSLFPVRPTLADANGSDDHSLAASEYSTAAEESPVVSRAEQQGAKVKKKRSLRQLFKRREKSSEGDSTEVANGDLGLRSHSHGGRKPKIKLISRAIKVKPVDIGNLRQLAISLGGLVSDEFRRFIWPLLADVRVGPSGVAMLSGLPLYTWEEVRGSADFNQVDMDVRRTLARFPPNMKEPQRVALQKQLTAMIVRVLLNHAGLHYYQGFHDICLTFLLVVGEELAYPICDKLATTVFREFLGSSLEETSHILVLMYPLIRQVDPELERFLWRADVGTMFALSWLITWYSHVIDDFRSIVRLYDLFLASHPLMPVYLGAAIVLYRSNLVLSGECDMAAVHSFLSKIPDDLPLETLINDATDLFERFPPSKLTEMNIRPRKDNRLAKMVFGGGEDFTEGRKSKKKSKAKRKLLSLTFWAVTATAAAVLIYSKYQGNAMPNSLGW